MTFEQKMQMLSTLGTWISGIGALAAAIIALWLARRVEKVKLRCYVGFQLLMGNGVSQDCVNFHVTNLGERPVTITSIGWRIGKRKAKRFAYQTVSLSSPSQLPKKLDHGETAVFMINLSESPNWISEFSRDFLSKSPLNTLRAEVHTSVGHIQVVNPANPLLKKFEAHLSS